MSSKSVRADNSLTGEFLSLFFDFLDFCINPLRLLLSIADDNYSNSKRSITLPSFYHGLAVRGKDFWEWESLRSIS